MLRREQLNADFRKAAGDEEEEPEEEKDLGDRNSDEEDQPHEQKASKAKVPKARAAKAKAKATAKSKAKAKAEAKSKSKRKAAKEEERPNKAADKNDQPAEEANASKPKRQRNEPSVQETGVSAVPAQEIGGKKRRGKQLEVEESKKVKGPTQTFAGRYCPEASFPAMRFNAIKHVFEERLAPLLRRQSAFQEQLQCPKFKSDLTLDPSNPSSINVCKSCAGCIL